MVFNFSFKQTVCTQIQYYSVSSWNQYLKASFFMDSSLGKPLPLQGSINMLDLYVDIQINWAKNRYIYSDIFTYSGE